jgi:hypothetical protein
VSSKGNPNKITYTDPVVAPGQTLVYDTKQVEFAAGVEASAVIVVAGNLKLSGELSLAHVVVADPTDGDGSADNGLYLSGASGAIGTIQTLGCKRDQGKVGSGTHDLVVGNWACGCAPPDPTDEGEEPVHRDGLQVSSCERVTIKRLWLVNQYLGATNGGIWVNPQKGQGDAVDQDDPTLIQDFVIEQARIIFPNAAVHLGACTRCGARTSLLAAQRPFRTDDRTVDAIDECNEQVVLDL